MRRSSDAVPPAPALDMLIHEEMLIRESDQPGGDHHAPNVAWGRWIGPPELAASWAVSSWLGMKWA